MGSEEEEAARRVFDVFLNRIDRHLTACLRIQGRRRFTTQPSTEQIQTGIHHRLQGIEDALVIMVDVIRAKVGYIAILMHSACFPSLKCMS